MLLQPRRASLGVCIHDTDFFSINPCRLPRSFPFVALLLTFLLSTSNFFHLFLFPALWTRYFSESGEAGKLYICIQATT